MFTLLWIIVDFILYMKVVRHPSSTPTLPKANVAPQTTTTLHLIFNLTIPKFYSLSLLVSLNARDSWKRDTTVSNSTTGRVGTGADGRVSGRVPRSLNVNMLRSSDGTKRVVSTSFVPPR